MQMIINELSANFPASSVEEGRIIMQKFLQTYFDVKKIIYNECVLLDKDYRSFELAENYRIEQWRNDPKIDREEKRRFLALLNKSTLYNPEEFENDMATEFMHDGKASIGCLLTYELEGVAISFLTHDDWKNEKIDGLYLSYSEEEDAIQEKQVNVPNVSCDNNVSSFSDMFEQQKKNLVQNTIRSGADILEYMDTVFQNLIFCDNAIQGCKNNVGVSEAGQVYKRLLELQNVAKAMNTKFDKNSLAKATTESSETLKRFEQEHTFLLPNGKTQLFSWHIRYTGGYAGRIFFYPVERENKIIVGHIGHKLPTVLYPH